MAANSATAIPSESAVNAERRADRLRPGDRPRVIQRAHDDRVVRHRRQLVVHDLGGPGEQVAHRAVHLGHGAQAQGILSTPAGAPT